jgi:hypothetical protein
MEGNSGNRLKPGVLYLVNDLQAGGAEMFLKRLGEGLSKHFQPLKEAVGRSSHCTVIRKNL